MDRASETRSADLAATLRAIAVEHGFTLDGAQQRALHSLQRLHEDLANAPPAWLQRLVRRRPVRGIYLWGAVGRGKSFLMDEFFRVAPIARKQRVHFHRFMQSIHHRLRDLQGQEDPLRVIAADGDISLPLLASKMNEFLYRTTPGNKYATFFFARLDGERRQLRYVNAGHNPPLLVRVGSTPDGGPDLHELTVGGSVVGMLPGLTYEEATIDLRTGDVLLAFTDGVTEAHNPDDEEFGDERLRDLARQVSHLSAGEIAACVSSALKDWIRDAEQFDDLTFVVMKVR